MAIDFPASPNANQTFTVGSITYKWDGAKWIGLGVTPADRLVEGSNSLEITAGNDLVWTGDNVGIKTTDPQSALEVVDNISFTSGDTMPQLRIKATSGALGKVMNLGLNETDDYGLIQTMDRGTGYSTALILQPYGTARVGIGAEFTDPDAKLEVRDSASQGIIIRSTNTQNTTANKALRIRNNSDVDTASISHRGTMLLGTTVANSFNGVGAEHGLVVAGVTSDTNIANNSGAAITISNTDGTASNTAGLHFAREDNDGNPHYSGASIVTQFRETQVTGEYPKADLAFLTSTAANNAPSEKFRIDADGNLKHLNTTPSAFTSSNPVSMRFWGRKCMQGTVYTTTTLDGSGNGQFSLGKIWLNDDTSIELFLSICPTNSATNKTHYAKVYLQKVRGQGMATVTIDRQDGADGSFSVSSITPGGYGGTGGSAHGTLVNVTGGSANVVYGITAFWTGISINNMY